MTRAEAEALRDAYLACFAQGWEKMLRESGEGGPWPAKVHAFFMDSGGRLEDLRSRVLAVAESRGSQPPPVVALGLGRGVRPKQSSSRLRPAGLGDGDRQPVASAEPSSNGGPNEPKNPEP